MKSIRRGQSDRGAALVEFALLLPLLLLLVLGIVELGFIIGQNNEIRHGAHEAARLAAVDDSSLGDNSCDAMGLNPNVTIDFTLLGGTSIGEQGQVTVSSPISSLSGLTWIEAFLPNQITTTVDFRLEQSATWNNTSDDRDPMGTPC